MPVRLEAMETSKMALFSGSDIGDIAPKSGIQLKQIPTYHFVVRAIIDIPAWFLLFWRDYTGENEYNKVVQHFYWFIFASCIINTCIQMDRQNWCYPWRAMSSVMIIHYGIALRSVNLGDGSIWLEFCRCALMLLRMMEAIWVWYNYGPYLDHLCDFIKQVRSFHQPCTFLNLYPLKWVFVTFMNG